MRKRKIKFALELKDGAKAYSIEDLREYFDLEKIIGYYHDNKLIEWLEDRFYAEEAEKIQALDASAKDFDQKLCEILGVECEEVADAEYIIWRKERLERLKQYTADPEILDKVDFVAFDQDDLEDIVREEDTKVIYLCGSNFCFPSGILRKKGVRYIGVGRKATAKIESREFVDLAALNISFDNVEVEGNYKPVGKTSVENEAVYAETNDNMRENDNFFDYIANKIIFHYNQNNPGGAYYYFQWAFENIASKMLRLEEPRFGDSIKPWSKSEILNQYEMLNFLNYATESFKYLQEKLSDNKAVFTRD